MSEKYDKEKYQDLFDAALKMFPSLSSELSSTQMLYTYTKTPFTDTDKRKSLTMSGLRADSYAISENLQILSIEEIINSQSAGGNYVDYFKYVKEGSYDDLKESSLFDKRNKDPNANDGYALVYDPLDKVSVTARGFYDEDFEKEIKVIAGNGRTRSDAENIWDQFRYGYHTYESVKNIFQQIYGLDPDSEELGDPLIESIRNPNKKAFPEFDDSTNQYKEFESLLGADWLNNANSTEKQNRRDALGKAVSEYLNAGFDGFDEQSQVIINEDKGLLDVLNKTIEARLAFIKDAVKNNIQLLSGIQNVNVQTQTTTPANTNTQTGAPNANTNQSGTSETTTAPADTSSDKSLEDLTKEYLAAIDTPKKLFLLLVGIFRQKLWSDPYSRAWIVLRPDKKRFVLGGDKETDKWSFRPIDKIWQAFIDYNSTYAKDSNKFKQLLVNNAKEGSSSNNWASGAIEDIDNFWDRNIGPIFTVFSSALGNLMNMFRMSMAQMGYGLGAVGNMAKQANVLNKAYNDSIYYSLGRPGTLLRAVDNPFTREYGEPVVEIREPFQRIHYISSFSHILANGIQENLSGVATQITAVSDGQYPVTVALDKAAPPERQVEKTIETGIYFDNIRGSGFFGILHPIFHPMQTIRGISKAASGEPDELTARRIGLAHLKESIKDIYQGELMLVGNPDIRPFDLVYLADVYERMYGIFEVEQVVHHFTPEMGFVTSITPNAFVTVNDPARWFMSSWISSHYSMQNLRNDGRLLLTGASNHNLINSNGTVSIDSLSESLKPQMLGGIMYTHGHSALMKDVMANMAADAIPDVAGQIKEKIKATTGKQDGSAGAAIAIAVGGPILTAAATAVGAVVGGPVGAGIGFSIGAVASDLAWSGWKWTRDNILDQHGCYVQYLNRNGQPMDAGLSFNQGMVVGRYHSKALLPGILGVRRNVRTAEGDSYIRSDDLFKSLGWKEKEISDLVRQISLENAIVNSELLKYSGIGPEKTGLNQLFKVIALVERVVDGDTFVVRDILAGDDRTFKIRFEGIDTGELYYAGLNGVLNAEISEISGQLSWQTGDPNNQNQYIYNPSSPGGKALKFTADAVAGKLIVLRINPRPDIASQVFDENDLEAGAAKNNPEYYSSAFKGQSYIDNSEDRYMASIFYKTDLETYSNIRSLIRTIFIKYEAQAFDQASFEESIRQEIKETTYKESVFYKYFDTIFDNIDNIPSQINYFEQTGVTDPLAGMTDYQKSLFSTCVAFRILEKIYGKASEWPLATWDEYYNDGSPVTLNWELVVNGLARVYTKGLIYNDSPARQELAIPMPTRVLP